MHVKEPEKKIEIRSAIDIPSEHTDALQADLYLPVVENRNGAAVLLVFGGSWRMGDRSQQRVYGISLAKAGFTCLACDYRLSQVAHWPAQQRDISAAAHCLKSMAEDLGVDDQRIGISGNSSGGQLALMSAADDNDWQPAAVCAFYPPTRLPPAGESGHDESFLQLMGPNARDEDFRKASPLQRIHEQYPPTLLIVGDADSRVTPDDTLLLYQAMKQADLNVELHSFAGQDHAFDMQKDMAMLCAQILVNFFKRYL